VKANVLKKCAVSTTAAQGHIGLLTSLTSDLAVIETLLKEAAPVPAIKAKTTTVTKPKTKDKDV
jgi:hypothetical protein